MTLKSELEVTQDHSNWYHSTIPFSSLQKLRLLYIYSFFVCIYIYIFLTLISIFCICHALVNKVVRESLGAVSYSPSMALSWMYSAVKRYIGRKIVIFFIPPLHSTPPVPVGILPSLLVWKTRVVGLPVGEKLRICVTV